MAAVITSSTSRVVRRPALAAAFSPVVSCTVSGVVLASPASANVPEDWSNPKPVDTLTALLVYVGAPLGLFLLIALAVFLPALARGEKRGGTDGKDSEWFGGPRKTTDELAAPDTEASQAGGASEIGRASGRERVGPDV